MRKIIPTDNSITRDLFFRETDSGAYQLVLELDRRTSVRVGALGTFVFTAGTYIYTGRAAKNLFARVVRHCRQDKALRWHIDYLLQQGRISEIRVFPDQAGEECEINLETAFRAGYTFPIKGFGSSDCRCPSHLVWLGTGKHR